jgi:hypothetical protein
VGHGLRGFVVDVAGFFACHEFCFARRFRDPVQFS